MKIVTIACAAAVLLCCVTSATAQSAAPATGSNGTVPEKTAPDTDIARKNGTLSDKLSDTNGVIHPETAVDPKIQKPPPATGTMQVIPPPGSPGGSSDVQPK